MKKFFFVIIVCFLMVDNVTLESPLLRLLVPFLCYTMGYILRGEKDDE